MIDPKPGRNPTQRNLTQISLAELRSRFQLGEFFAVDAVRACLEKIAAGNAELRAFISVRESEALREAEAADSARAAGSTPGLLWGVPLAVKDLIDVRGMRTTAASRVRWDAPEAEEDAECVRRLRKAGAIVIGKTNLHEFAYGGSGVVSAYGAARNPLDLARVCGGSSSGSAAAVAAGMCSGALGTDTAGSIRLPAACCGVVGFKPTWGAVPVAGVVPLAWSYDHVGPLARTVEDAAMLFAVLAGQEALWAESFEGAGQQELKTKLRCGVARKCFCQGLAPEVEAGFERALDAVHSLGWSLQEVELDVSEDRTASNAESWAYHQKMVTEHGELYDPRTLPRIVNGKKVGVESYIEARRELELLRERMHAGVFGVDIVLTPTSPILPPSPEEFAGPEARTLELKMLRNTRLFNVLGWPAVSLPSGPMVGVQVSAAWGQDWQALKAARAIERALHLRR